MTDERIKRLTELAQLIDPGAYVVEDGEAFAVYGATMVRGGYSSSAEIIRLNPHPRALDALETALRVLATPARPSRVVSEPGSGITITAYELTDAEKRGLSSGGARIPKQDDPPAESCMRDCDGYWEQRERADKAERELSELRAKRDAMRAPFITLMDQLRSMIATQPFKDAEMVGDLAELDAAIVRLKGGL